MGTHTGSDNKVNWNILPEWGFSLSLLAVAQMAEA
jgi:hypothetical protein